MRDIAASGYAGTEMFDGNVAAYADRPDELRELQVEMIDRFGLLPPPAQNLFRIAELKQQARALGLRRIDVGAAPQPESLATPAGPKSEGEGLKFWIPTDAGSDFGLPTSDF